MRWFKQLDIAKCVNGNINSVAPIYNLGYWFLGVFLLLDVPVKLADARVLEFLGIFNISVYRINFLHDR